MNYNHSSALIVFTVVSFMSCNDASTNTETIDNSSTTSIEQKNATPEIENDTLRLIKEEAERLGVVIKDAVAEHRKIDSIRQASKQPMWVYQIGSPYNDEKLVAKAYDQLTDISHVYVFKKSKKEWYLIKDDGYTKEKLEEDLGEFKKTVYEPNIKIVNLSLECSSKKEPTMCDGISLGKRKGEAPCKKCE